jgi:long-subunit fatty acid transport protein
VTAPRTYADESTATSSPEIRCRLCSGTSAARSVRTQTTSGEKAAASAIAAAADAIAVSPDASAAIAAT